MQHFYSAYAGHILFLLHSDSYVLAVDIPFLFESVSRTIDDRIGKRDFPEEVFVLFDDALKLFVAFHIYSDMVGDFEAVFFAHCLHLADDIPERYLRFKSEVYCFFPPIWGKAVFE